MKKLSIIVLLIVLTFNGFSKSTAGSTIIAGCFSEYKNYSGKIEICIIDNSNLVSSIPKQYTVNCIHGYFKLKMTIEHPVYFAILDTNTLANTLDRDLCGIFYRFAVHPMIEPGDSLFLKIDSINGHPRNKLSFIEFSGKGSLKNYCLKGIFDQLEKNEVNMVLSQAFSDSIYLVCLNIIFKERMKLNSTSLLMLKADITGIVENIMHDLCIAANSADKTYFELRKKYLEFIRNNWLVISGILQYCAYARNFLIRKAICQDYHLTDSIPGDDLHLYGLQFAQFYDIIGNNYKGQLKDYLICGPLIRRMMWNSELNLDMESVIAKFKEQTKDVSVYRNQVLFQFNKLKDILLKGSLDFSLTDSSGRRVSLDVYKGKVVVIDFMFNGCHGCRQLVPYLTQFEEKFKNNQQIAFISVSIDRSEKLFKDGIGIYSAATSLPLYTGGKGYEHPIIRYYKVFSYPCVVIIDQDQKILKNGNPDYLISNPDQFVRFINDLLKQNDSTFSKF